MVERLKEVLHGIGSYVLMVIEMLGLSFRRFPSWAQLRDQLCEIGAMSVPVVIITGFSIGLVLAAQSFYQLADKGLAGATGLMVAKAMLTEIGPVVTAFMITGRVGAAMCAEIGTMGVTEQLDALRSMAVHPSRYLVAPRVIAATTMLPLLTIFSSLLGIMGGYIISVFFFSMSPSEYWQPIPIYVGHFDLFTGLVKGFFFGFLISTISCYKGLTTLGGAAGVGRSTTQSVVICYCCILIANFMLTVILHTARITLGIPA